MLESESRRAPAPMELDGVQGTLGKTEICWEIAQDYLLMSNFMFSLPSKL